MTRLVTLLVSRPLLVMLQAVAGSVCVAYLQNAAVDSLLWFIPCLFATIADLSTGIRAARYRKERVSMSTALRRTGNKIVVYSSWVMFAVTCGMQFKTDWCTPMMMGVVLFIEMISIISNLLEPHGLTISWKGVLSVIGRRHNVDNLEDVIEKKDDKTGDTTEH